MKNYRARYTQLNANFFAVNDVLKGIRKAKSPKIIATQNLNELLLYFSVPRLKITLSHFTVRAKNMVVLVVTLCRALHREGIFVTQEQSGI